MNVAPVSAVVRELAASYGSPDLGNPSNPLDDLIFIILSNRSSPAPAQRIYRELKSEHPTWDTLAAADDTRLAMALRPLGLSQLKATQIKMSLAKIRADFGACDLSALRHLPIASAEEYLTSLPGVSKKVAKCVLLFAFEMEVLPVDVHVHRVATRLGWTSRRRADQSHDDLEKLIPPEYRRAFHVNAIAHGRELCRPRNPRCHACPIGSWCLVRESH